MTTLDRDATHGPAAPRRPVAPVGRCRCAVGRCRWPCAAGLALLAGVPAVRAVVARARRGGAAGRRRAPAAAARRRRPRPAHRAGAVRPAAELDQPARRLPAVAAAVRCCEAGYLALLGAAARLGRRPLVDRWPVGVAAADRAAVGRAGGAARPDPVRRVPVGAAGVQPGRLAAAAAGRARRRAAGHLRGGARRRAARRWRCLAAPRRWRRRRRRPRRRWAAAARRAPCWRSRRRAGRCRLLVPVGAAGRRHRARWRSCRATCPGSGLDFNAQRRAVLDNHVDATLELAGGSPPAQAAQPDLVVWPENSSDIDPLRNPTAGARDHRGRRRDRRADPGRRGAARPRRPGRSATPASSGSPAPAPDLDQLYVKRHPVPFAEYVPLRDVARMVSKQGRPGPQRLRRRRRTPGVVRVGPAVLGDVICFEVAYDEHRPRHRHRRRAAAGGADQQRHLRRGRGPPAAGHGAAAGGRARPDGADGLHGRGVRRSSHPTGGYSDATGFNTRAVVVRQMRLGDGVRLPPASAAGPRWRSPRWPSAALVGAAAAAPAGSGSGPDSNSRYAGGSGGTREPGDRYDPTRGRGTRVSAGCWW